MDTNELRNLLALHLTPGIGPRLLSALTERFGSPGAALRASPAELREVPQVGPKVAEAVAAARQTGAADAELERVRQHGVQLFAAETPDYPPMLNGIPDQPLLLYVRGTLLLSDANAVAVVGSRHV